VELLSEKVVLKELNGNPFARLNEVLVKGTVKGEQPLYESASIPEIGLFTTLTVCVTVDEQPTLFNTIKEMV
jgi:hypothetical protein